MNRSTRTVLSTALLCAAAATASAAVDPRPTAGFREGHAGIREHLAHLDTMIGTLDGASAGDQRKTMAFVASFLTEHILGHAAWEEAHLYPLVDEKAGRQGEPFTASMRYEHGIISRAIADLGKRGEAEAPDVEAFARAAVGTLRVIAAHFEKEEEVFLPLLDRTMTRAQVDAALRPAAGH